MPSRKSTEDEWIHPTFWALVVGFGVAFALPTLPVLTLGVLVFRLLRIHGLLLMGLGALTGIAIHWSARHTPSLILDTYLVHLWAFYQTIWAAKAVTWDLVLPYARLAWAEVLPLGLFLAGLIVWLWDDWFTDESPDPKSPTRKGRDAEDEDLTPLEAFEAPVPLHTAKEPPPQKWLLDQLIPAAEWETFPWWQFWKRPRLRGVVSFLIADAGTGKSTWALYLSLLFATGGIFLDTTPVEQQTVIYFDGELTKGHFIRRAKALASGMGIDLPRNLIYARLPGPLPHPQVHAWVVRQIRRYGATVAFWDSMTMGTAETSSQVDPGETTRIIKRLLEPTGLPWIIIDHVSGATAKAAKGKKDQLRPFGGIMKYSIARSILGLIPFEGGFWFTQQKTNFGGKTEPLKILVQGGPQGITGYQLASDEEEVALPMARPQATVHMVNASPVAIPALAATPPVPTELTPAQPTLPLRAKPVYDALLAVHEAHATDLAATLQLPVQTVRNTLSAHLKPLGLAHDCGKGRWRVGPSADESALSSQSW